MKYPNGGYDNVYPDGTVRTGKGGRGTFSDKAQNISNNNSANNDWNWGLAVAGIGLIIFTVAEDILSGGVGVADDPATIMAGIGMIVQGAA